MLSKPKDREGVPLPQMLLARRRLTTIATRMEVIIRTKIDDALRPIHVELVNESSKHNVPKGSESHFKLLVVSDAFEGKSLIERHRLVNSVLKDELQKGIHALSIQAKTPSQHAANPAVSSTPNCLGGSKS